MTSGSVRSSTAAGASPGVGGRRSSRAVCRRIELQRGRGSRTLATLEPAAAVDLARHARSVSIRSVDRRAGEPTARSGTAGRCTASPRPPRTRRGASSRPRSSCTSSFPRTERVPTRERQHTPLFVGRARFVGAASRPEHTVDESARADGRHRGDEKRPRPRRSLSREPLFCRLRNERRHLLRLTSARRLETSPERAAGWLAATRA
jgi:hypothetical protein